MKYVSCGLALLSVFLTFGGDEHPGSPLVQAHAHNDYLHRRPLWDALAQGFCSVEADIYLVDGALLVAHNRPDVRPERTLEKLYLEPLAELVRTNGGRVYPNGPPVTLLIDIKTDGEPTYGILRGVLEKYQSMLTHFGDTRIDTNAVTVILTGNRPRETLLSERSRLASFDGRLSDLGRGLSVSFMPLVSDTFLERFPSAKAGALSAEDQAAFAKAIQQAHGEGRRIRFWATKDDEETWAFLKRAGVDLINADDLSGLAAFLRKEAGK